MSVALAISSINISKRSSDPPERRTLRHESYLACLCYEVLLNICSGMLRQVLADLGNNFSPYVGVTCSAQIRQGTRWGNDKMASTFFARTSSSIAAATRRAK